MSETKSLDIYQEKVRCCHRCNLVEGCHQPIPGYGHGPILILQEKPDAEEDFYDELLSGRSGHYLKKCLAEAQLNNDLIYFTNLVKCKGKPKQHNIERCKIWLWQEIQMVRPKVILALGQRVAISLLKNEIGNKQKLKDMIGKTYEVSYMRSKIVVWYSLNYLLGCGEWLHQQTLNLLRKLQYVECANPF